MVRTQRRYPIIPSPLHSMEDYHVHYTLNDPDFQSEVRIMARAARGDIHPGNDHVDAFIRKYLIPIDEVRRYLKYGKRGSWFPPKSYFDVQRSTDNPSQWIITLDKSAMQSDVLKAYELFDADREVIYPELAARRRAPEQPDLIYAIFCQRRVNTGWRQIFQMYQSGNLPNYQGSGTQYETQKSLETHYRRYKPTSG